ncbi:hypothetical protein GGI00_001758, partial [Coemansia sp. RSA 2681]
MDEQLVSAIPIAAHYSAAVEGALNGTLEDALAARVAQCTESSEAERADECLAELQAYVDQRSGFRDAAIQHALSQHVPRLLAHFKWYVRARAYRLLRRLASPQALEYCRQYVELCVMHTLVLDDSAHGEREQGLKFVRWTMRFGARLWLLSPQVVKTMLAVAEQADDRMRCVCLETLCELLVRDPERLWYVNGVRTLTQAALDGPWAISIAIASALAHVFDGAATRRFIHPGITLGGVASALTEPAGADQALTERAKVAAFMLTQLLKSWGGIQYFLADGRHVIAALVRALATAGANAKVILGMLLELFGLSDDFDAVQFEQQPRFDVDLLAPFHVPPHAITQAAARSRLQPVDYVRTLLLMTFVDEGLVEALVASALEARLPDVADASATLLKWLAQHPRMPLPEPSAARFHTLRALVDRALEADARRALAARRIVARIDAMPSLSLGPLPSHASDAWAASLASSVFYRRFLRQRRLRADIARPPQLQPPRQAPMPRRASHAAPADAPGAEGDAGTPRGLAAGLKDNAARVLRSSASTGNLKTGGGSSSSALSAACASHLSTVNEDAASAEPAAADVLARGRRSLDVLRNPPQNIAQSISAASQSIDGAAALLTTTPPLIARSRTKSRSRSRNSIVIVNSLGVEETPLAALIQESRVTAEDNPMLWDWPAIRTIILGPISAGGAP